MKKHFLYCFCIIISFKTYAQQESISGARSYGLAGNAILFKDVWSANNNPAGLGNLKTWNVGFSYENQFLLQELSNKTAVFTLPVSSGSFGFSVNQFGYSNFNENKIGLSYGQQLSKGLSMGIQINYLNTSLGGNYGSNSAISGNVGLIAQLTQELTLATTIINPNKAQLSELNDERYPTLIKMGLGYKFSDKLNLLSEIVKDIDFESNVRFGIEYKAISKLYLRAGYATQPALSSFGFGLNLALFKIDFASSFDSNLGFSPQISFSYTPEKKK